MKYIINRYFLKSFEIFFNSKIPFLKIFLIETLIKKILSKTSI